MKSLVGRYGVAHVPGPLGDAISLATGHWANHAFIVTSPDEVVEAWVPSAHVRKLSDYSNMRVEFNDREPMSRKERDDTVRFAEAALGWKYDYLHFIALGFYYFLGLDLLNLPHLPSSSICSRLVALSGHAAGLDWTGGNKLNHVTPATLARRLGHVA